MLEASLLSELPPAFRRASLDKALEKVCTGCHRYRREFTEYKTAAAWAASLAWERDADRDRALLLVDDHAVVELVATGDTLTIALLLVASSARFAGVGRKIVNTLAETASRRGFTSLSIGVHNTNTDALTFWSRLGFSDAGFLGQGDHGIVQMERLISARESSLHP